MTSLHSTSGIDRKMPFKYTQNYARSPLILSVLLKFSFGFACSVGQSGVGNVVEHEQAQSGRTQSDQEQKGQNPHQGRPLQGQEVETQAGIRNRRRKQNSK